MSRDEEIRNGILQIWRNNGIEPPVSNEALMEALLKPANLQHRMIYYGNYCGPLTNDTTRPPVDSLDASCWMHDHFFTSARYADKSLFETAKYLIAEKRLESPSAVWYANAVGSPAFLFASATYKQSVTIIIIFSIFLLVVVSLIGVHLWKKKHGKFGSKKTSSNKHVKNTRKNDV